MNLLLKNKDKKWLILLLMDNFRCLYTDKVLKSLEYSSERSVKYNLKKAEEKVLINKEFREEYFEIEENIKKNF